MVYKEACTRCDLWSNNCLLPQQERIERVIDIQINKVCGLPEGHRTRTHNQSYCLQWDLEYECLHQLWPCISGKKRGAQNCCLDIFWSCLWSGLGWPASEFYIMHIEAHSLTIELKIQICLLRIYMPKKSAVTEQKKHITAFWFEMVAYSQLLEEAHWSLL